MKTFAIILLFAAIGCYAGDTSDITNKVFEMKGDDGKVSFRIETTYRGKAKVMMEMFRPNAQGMPVISSRSYFAGGDMVMSECDDHKSGKLDTIIVYHPGTDDIEMFTRQADGSVKPVSTQTLEAIKQEGAVTTNFFLTLPTNPSDEEISKRLKETQKKIQDIEKQKTDEKR